ncbi:hypothetical protein ACRAWG_31040 [Methylobacterium sp. P31]
MSDEPDDPPEAMRAALDQLAATNVLLAEWTACALEDSPTLIERLENMGYEVRGKSREGVVEVLKQPPSRPATRVNDTPSAS